MDSMFVWGCILVAMSNKITNTSPKKEKSGLNDAEDTWKTVNHN